MEPHQGLITGGRVRHTHQAPLAIEAGTLMQKAIRRDWSSRT